MTSTETIRSFYSLYMMQYLQENHLFRPIIDGKRDQYKLKIHCPIQPYSWTSLFPHQESAQTYFRHIDNLDFV